jgi:hypothetical protein
VQRYSKQSMRMLTNAVRGLFPVGVLSFLSISACGQGVHAKDAPLPTLCRKVVLDGEVSAGQSYEKAFTPGLKFLLEPLRSGWIVRVLDTNEPRGAHDYAELATPPYESVSPLLISTDWSFRAQDAVAWNPRSFRYAKDRTSFRQLSVLQPKVLAGDPQSSLALATLVAAQLEGSLHILNARIAPGSANQAGMASPVASHLASTEHETDSSSPPSPLGKLESLQFSVELQVPMGQPVVTGIRTQPCSRQPTGPVAPASQQVRTRTDR